MSEKQLNKKVYTELFKKEIYKPPVKVIQIGDGNFIRSFIDWFISLMNKSTNFNGSVVTVQALPADTSTPKINAQDGLFTLLLKGKSHGEIVDEKYIVDSINYGINPYTEWDELLDLAKEEQVEFLFSNTTEAGIAYIKEGFAEGKCPVSYPGKVTALLYHRYKYYNGNKNKGWIIVPCELIENNGDELKRICLQIADDWNLTDDFKRWIDEACVFCNTLVDRIVPGFPKDNADEIYSELGYRDELLAVAEPYHLFVVEGPEIVEQKLPFKEAGLNVQFDSVATYRELKVKLLNAPHTILASIGLLTGIDIVRRGMEDPDIFRFLNNALADEIIITMQPAAKEKANTFVEEVYDRFANPFLDHKLTDISLNSYSKFRTRVWPSIYAYREKFGRNPQRLVFAFAALIHYFKGVIEEKNYKVKDNEATLNRFKDFYTSSVTSSRTELTNYIRTMIEQDFLISGEDMGDLYEAIADNFLLIEKLGIRGALQQIESRDQ